jgi:twinkle protein
VTTDSPEFLERTLEPERKLVDLGSQNVRQIHDAWLRKQRDFSTTPFDPEGAHLKLFPGGVTIWSGFPGAGKTSLLRQLVCHQLNGGQSVFVASLEEDPTDMFVRLAATAAGKIDPTESDLEWFIFSFVERLKLWGMIGLTRHLEILALIRVLAKRGCRHSVIDSLMCLDIDSRDWEAQRQFAIALTTTARTSGCHIHLVAHPKKPMGPDQEPDLNDVAGSADLGRLVDNIVFVRRAKNEALLATDVTPMSISIRKQRHGSGACGDVSGWFHRGFRQYVREQSTRSATRYLPDEAYTEVGA